METEDGHGSWNTEGALGAARGSGEQTVEVVFGPVEDGSGQVLWTEDSMRIGERMEELCCRSWRKL